ncbi:DNA polymerase III subunit beta [Oerskovia jenensis]|uniref:DNA polymerase III subunit beta n=1 Tax=Oerskovia jenensis TaxID=162169 RepID=UPI0036DF8DFC
MEAAGIRPAAQWVAKLLPNRPAVPVLGGVVLEAVGGELALSAFDYEVHARVVIPAAGLIEGRLLVHGKLFAEALGRMTGTVRMNVEGGRLVLDDGRRTIRLFVFPGDDYPATPEAPVTSGPIEAAALTRMLTRAAVAVGADEGKSLPLHGVKLHADDQTLTVYATNRYIAVQVSESWSGTPFDAVVDARRLLESVKGMNGPVELGANENHVAVRARDRKVTIGLIGNEYPAVERLLVQEPTEVRAVANRDDLVDAIATARMSVDTGKPLSIRFSPHELVLYAEGTVADSSAVIGVVECTATETLYVNPTYLLEITQHTPGPCVLIGPGASPKKPLVVLGADSTGEPDPSTKYVLVPIRMTPGGA